MVLALLRTSVIALGLPAVLMSMVAAGSNVMGIDGGGTKSEGERLHCFLI